MKKIISFFEAAKKHSFANAACIGRFYEPEVPKNLL